MTTWWLLGDRLVTTWWLLGDHYVTTWWPLGDYLETIWWPLGDIWGMSGWCLGQHLGHIVNNGQQSAVLHASVMPFFFILAPPPATTHFSHCLAPPTFLWWVNNSTERACGTTTITYFSVKQVFNIDANGISVQLRHCAHRKCYILHFLSSTSSFISGIKLCYSVFVWNPVIVH